MKLGQHIWATAITEFVLGGASRTNETCARILIIQIRIYFGERGHLAIARISSETRHKKDLLHGFGYFSTPYNPYIKMVETSTVKSHYSKMEEIRWFTL